MKKVVLMLMVVGLLLGSITAPVFASGGKNHGDVGQGAIGDQGQGDVTRHCEETE